MSSKLRVAVGGASGQTGLTIVNALLEDGDQFEAIALARPESLNKDIYIDLQQRGVTVKGVTFTDLPAVVTALQNVDVVISCLTIEQKEAEIGLIDAAKQANVRRFVPSFFATVSPRGVQDLRDQKLQLLDHIQRLYLPFTVIDVGWWYQTSIPSTPSGRLDSSVSVPVLSMYGDGNTPSAFIDYRDIGKYVTRVIADPRTLNKHVFMYTEVSTQERIWSEIEKLTGEQIPRKYTSKEETEQTIKQCKDLIAANSASGQFDPLPFLHRSLAEYYYSWAIRGDNTPEHAEYLGYLLGKDLYPDLEGTSVSTFLKDLVEGRTEAKVYEGRPEHPSKALKGQTL